MDQRTYNQYCATARTLDLIGERWTLLLIRELLTGPKRFGELQQTLRGLGTGLLAARLKQLESQGIVEKVMLPAPARTPAYNLTAAGQGLEPVVLSLARWGLQWAMGEPHEGETFHPGWAMLGLKACFDSTAARDLRAVYEFRIDDEIFYVRVDDGTIETAHGPAQHPDVIITTSGDHFRDIAAGRSSLKEATVKATGSRLALRRLPAIFQIPSSRTRTAAPSDPLHGKRD